LAITPAKTGNYFTGPKENLKFISTGCALLDCALGGGWAIGRVVNVVGDSSTSKTGLASEALINFKKQYPNGKAAYRDTEAAFDHDYAAEMGLPVAKIDFGDEDGLTTVEGFARDLEKFLDDADGKPCIYVLDSLDALSDEDEMENDIGKATFGAKKAKTLSTMFRKLTAKIEQKQCLLFVVSQVRDNIGALFGEKHKRSGGKALDFYASQVLWLARIKLHKHTIKKVERPWKITVRAKVKKNKVGLPFRECDFDFVFGFGVDDVGASINWLDEVGRLEDARITNLKAHLAEIEKSSDSEYAQERADLTEVVQKVWAEIETTFLPKRKKY
jgi:recombination protein RecA